MENSQNKIIKAGGIVVKEDDGQKFVLLVYRKKENDWSFPKGHIENGESIKETIAREMEEETGLKIDFIKELPSNEYVNSRTGDKTITHMFLLKPISGDIRPEHESDQVEWMSLENVRERLSYDNLKEYFDKIKKEL
jgi:8-oxo-dGTP diphosphatase